MSERPWHTPRPVELIPPHFSWRQNLAMAVGLAVLILAIRLSRVIPK